MAIIVAIAPSAIMYTLFQFNITKNDDKKKNSNLVFLKIMTYINNNCILSIFSSK